MKYEVHDVNQCVKELSINVPVEQALNDYRAVLSKFKNYVAVPGFRKGKAPMSMVENLFFDKAKESYLNEKMYEYYEEALKLSELKPLYDPIPLEMNWSKGEDLTAKFRLEIAPQVNVTNYSGIEIEHNHIEFSEKMLEYAIKGMLENVSEEKDIEGPIEKGDLITIEISWLDNEEAEPEQRKVEVGNNGFGDMFNEDVLGKSITDVVQTTIEINEPKQNVRVLIEGISRKVLPELTDELAKDFDYESVADMREKVGAELKKNVEADNQRYKEISLLDKLFELNKFDVPPTSVFSYSLQLAEPYAKMSNKKPEDFARFFMEKADRDIKTFYLINDLIEKLNIESTEEDKDELLKTYADSMAMTLEEYREKNPDVTNNDEFVYSVKERKLIKHLLESNTFVPAKKKELKEGSEEVKEENKE